MNPDGTYEPVTRADGEDIVDAQAVLMERR
jgi:hypothetical protein